MAVVVVANANSVEENTLSSSEVRQVFTLEKIQWKNKRSIVVFVLPANDLLHKSFCEEVLEIYPHQLQRMWDRYLFSENNSTVVVAQDKNDLLKSIAITPGAIGYLDEQDYNEKIMEIKKIEITHNSYKDKDKDKDKDKATKQQSNKESATEEIQKE